MKSKATENFSSFHSFRLTRAAVILVSTLGSPVTASQGQVDSIQIDWVLPSDALASGTFKPGEANYVFKLLPRRLVETDADVMAKDGSKLLPAGAQLYQMLGSVLMACSQTKSAVGYVGASNRVCLRDTNADGLFDSFFLRKFGRDTLMSDGMWFAMNSRLPDQLEPINPASAREIDRRQALERPNISWKLKATKKGNVSFNMKIEFKQEFTAWCEPGYSGSAIPQEIVMPCGGENVFARVLGAGGAKEALQVSMDLPDRDVGVIFDVDPRLLGGRLMRGLELL